MRVWVYLPLLLSCLFGVAAPRIARRLPPSVATWLLSVGGEIAAVSSSSSLALLAFVLAAQNLLVSERGRWSDEVLRAHGPLAMPVGTLALIAVIVLAAQADRAG